jgi:cytochrome P450
LFDGSWTKPRSIQKVSLKTTISLLKSVFSLDLINEKRLREEVDNVLGERMSLNFDDINKLEYTGCVFKETLRKWPSTGQFSRQTTQSLSLNGVYIPENTWVCLSPFVSSRNPNNFPNPEEFIPERFMKDSPTAKQNK